MRKQLYFVLPLTSLASIAGLVWFVLQKIELSYGYLGSRENYINNLNVSLFGFFVVVSFVMYALFILRKIKPKFIGLIYAVAAVMFITVQFFPGPADPGLFTVVDKDGRQTVLRIPHNFHPYQRGNETHVRFCIPPDIFPFDGSCKGRGIDYVAIKSLTDFSESHAQDNQERLKHQEIQSWVVSPNVPKFD